MENASEIPQTAELEREQLALNVERLKIENKKLARESEPEKWWSKLTKNVLAFGGIATVIGTTYGLYDSYTKTITERTHARVAEARGQFEDAVKRLEANGTVSKLVGVAILGGYFKPENKDFHAQVLFTLGGLAATEQDMQTQTALADLITGIPAGVISEKDWYYFQDVLASQSRALVSKGDLYRHRQFAIEGVTPSSEELSARFVGKLIAINARKGVAKEYSNYSGIYCAGCDFHGVVFPRRTSFSSSILDNANFGVAHLEEAVFDNADLGGTNFVNAYLGNSYFRSLSAEAIKGQPVTEEIERRTITPFLLHAGALLETRATITVSMPDFSCANLESANFDHFGLIPVPPMAERKFAKGDDAKPGWYKTVPQYIRDDAIRLSSKSFEVALVRPAKFYMANLNGAQLGSSRSFIYSYKDESPDRFGSGFGMDFGEPSVSLSSAVVDEVLKVRSETTEAEKKRATDPKPDFPDDLTSEQRRHFQDQLQATFFQITANEQTKLPGGIADFLKNFPGKSYRGVKCDPALTPRR
jgi:uncharacterized protein YjbI with pentapeptide repeats